MHRIISLLIGVLTTVLVSSAQKAAIERVEAVPFEVIPAGDRRVDLNQEPCALVHVEVLANDVIFEGNVIGPVVRAGGEYRVFLSPGSKFLRIKSESFLPLMIEFPDYGIKGVQPNGVYSIILSLPVLQTPATTKTGMLSVNYEPAGASITIDGISYGKTPSTIANLSVGSHPVTISADGYTPAYLTAIITENRLAELTGALVLQPADIQPAAPPIYEQVNYYYIYQDYSTGKFGYKEYGEIVIPAEFDMAGNFSEGLAPVSVYGRWGFIDKIGELVIPAEFDIAEPFSEGLAKVRLNGKWGYIDKTGKIVIPAEFESGTNFSEGLAAVKLKDKWGYIDKTGQLVIPYKFDGAFDFDNDGKALVGKKGHFFYIDRKGKKKR